MSPTNLAILATVERWLAAQGQELSAIGLGGLALDCRRHAEMLANVIRAEERDAEVRSRRSEMGLVK